MPIVYIGLGSNLGDPEQYIHAALEELGDIPETKLVNSSSLYRSAPMGPGDQSDYINAVAQLETTLPAMLLLDQLQGIEQKHGRIRDRHWGPRTLDLDLLLYGDMKIDSDTLTVPHPGISMRNFVLCPLIEINPVISIPGLGPAAGLLEDLVDTDAGRIEKL